MSSRRRARILALVGLVVVALALAFIVRLVSEPTAAERQAAAIAAARARLLRHERREVAAAIRLVATPPPTASGDPAPTGSALFTRPLRAHEVVGFVPYWELSSLVPDDYSDVSTLCYFGPTLTASGGISTDQDFETRGYEGFVAAAHAKNDAVLLTISSATDPVIDKALANASTSADHLATAADADVRRDGLQGVDLDIEGTQASEREAYVRFVQDFARRWHVLDPGGSLVVDTYVSAAGQGGFFDVKPIGRAADELFVMGYDMDLVGQASANAPLISPDLGISDVQALLAYLRLVPARKLILGMPFYGYDFPTDTTRPGALASAPPEAIVYSSIVTAGHPSLWDPTTETPYAAYTKDRATHEIYFDDPASIALKTALAQVLDLRGVGAWALGMEGGNTAMLAALTGGAAPLRGVSD